MTCTVHATMKKLTPRLDDRHDDRSQGSSAKEPVHCDAQSDAY